MAYHYFQVVIPTSKGSNGRIGYGVIPVNGNIVAATVTSAINTNAGATTIDILKWMAGTTTPTTIFANPAHRPSIPANGYADDATGAAFPVECAKNESVSIELAETPLGGTPFPLTVVMVIDDGIVAGGGGGGGGGAATGGDSIPAAPTAQDDEFESDTIDAKWTKTTAGTLTEEYNSRLKSYIGLTLRSGTAEYKITQPFAPGDVQWSLTAAFVGDPSSNYHLLSMRARNADNSNFWENRFWYNSSVRIDAQTKDFGTETVVGSTTASNTSNSGKFYFHIQRIYNSFAESVFSSWWSLNGITWIRYAQQNFDFTLANVDLFASTYGSSAQFRCGFDWVRRDWVFLTQ